MASVSLVRSVARKSSMNSLLCLLKSSSIERTDVVRKNTFSKLHVTGTYRLRCCCNLPAAIPVLRRQLAVAGRKSCEASVRADLADRTVLSLSLSPQCKIHQNESQESKRAENRCLGKARNAINLTLSSRLLIHDVGIPVAAVAVRGVRNTATTKSKRLFSGQLEHRPTTAFHCSRYYSRNQRDDHEETKMQVRGGAMYLPNPLTWLSAMWNKAKLRHKLDPAFSERGFLQGAQQAISFVMTQVSRGGFEQLKDVATDEAIAVLRDHHYLLSEIEKEALALTPRDMVLLKIRDVHLSNEDGAPQAFVDTFCVGLRVVEDTPYLVSLDIRFKRNYSTKPPSDWIVAGVSRMHVDNLGD